MTGPTKARTVPPTGPDSAYAGMICTPVITHTRVPGSPGAPWVLRFWRAISAVANRASSAAPNIAARSTVPAMSR
ncbi:hypothetical protein [Streptomyces niveus]|uniref:hypothetical protein n=1 Tax=Streptomyces niveus TaxID=193462 RepID=UPI003F4E0A83